MGMREHVARHLCYAAAAENIKHCPTCDEETGECTMWASFVKESDACILAVRDFARLDMRRKPNLRRPNP